MFRLSYFVSFVFESPEVWTRLRGYAAGALSFRVILHEIRSTTTELGLEPGASTGESLDRASQEPSDGPIRHRGPSEGSWDACQSIVFSWLCAIILTWSVLSEHCLLLVVYDHIHVVLAVRASSSLGFGLKRMSARIFRNS